MSSPVARQAFVVRLMGLESIMTIRIIFRDKSRDLAQPMKAQDLKASLVILLVTSYADRKVKFHILCWTL